MLKKIGIFTLIAFVLVASGLLARQQGSRLSSSRRYEYVIVTPLQFAGVFQKLADWKTEKGVPAKVVTTEFIKKNYTSGKLTYRIREFLKDAYKNWGTKWVLLGGDTEGKQGPLIPVVYARSGIKNTDIPSDLYYSDLTGSWNANGNNIFGEFKDNVDLKPELYVGRASVDTEKEASDFVDKVLRYEKRPPANWVKTAVLAASELDENTFAERGAEQLVKKYLKGFKVKKYYHLRGSDAAHFKAGVNKYSPHFVYVGAHGNQTLFGFNGQFTNKDADELTNKFPFIYTSISCLTNYFDKDSLSEHIMNNPKSGAVAYWACSREGWYQPRNEGYFYSILMIKDFYNLLMNDPANVSDNIGMVVARARAKYIPEAKKSDSQFRWLIYGMNLLGDPEMPIWTDEPKQLRVSVVQKDIKKGRLGVKVTSSGKAVPNARLALEYFDDKNLILTATAKNFVPAQVSIKTANTAGVYSVAKTGRSGIALLSLKAKTSVVKGLIDELLALDASVKEMSVRLKKMRSNKSMFLKISRDYRFLVNKLQKRQNEIKKFFMTLVENKDYSKIEATLDYIGAAFRSNPSGKAQFGFVLQAISSKISFSLVHLQGNPNGVQTRIFKKILNLKKQLPKDSIPQEQLGRIKVISKPAGADVYLNNIPQGKTPCVIEKVAFGSYVIKLKAQGLKAVASRVTVNRQKTIVKTFTLAQGCRIRGKVTFENTGKVAVGAKVQILANKNGKLVVIGEKTIDKTGMYDFRGLPKLYLYADVTLAGYNESYKPFIFSQRDQGFNRTWNVPLYPLAEVSGKLAAAPKSELRMFKKEKHGYVIYKKLKTSNSTFKVKNVELGTYKLIYSVPGKNLCIKEFKITKGLDKKFNLKPLALKTVDFFYRQPGERYSHEAMRADEKGVYAVSLGLKKGRYIALIILNFEDYKNGGPLTSVVLPDQKIVGADGMTTNAINVTKDQKVEFKWDSNKLPVYYRIENRDEKQVEVLTEPASTTFK